MNRRATCVLVGLIAILSFGHAAFAQSGAGASYPQVKVDLLPAYKPDEAFEKFHQAFVSAVASKDLNALSALIAPGFVWTISNALAADHDPGRDGQHNFRVTFGFRPPGKDEDGPVENGPFWDLLQSFANDKTFYQLTDAGNLICTPMGATVADDDVFQKAISRLESVIDNLNWYFAIRSVPAARTPGDKGPFLGKLGAEAFPVVSMRPEDGDPQYYEVVLPSGRTGWIPADAARPLQADRLCFAKMANGNWGIAIYDAAGE